MIAQNQNPEVSPDRLEERRQREAGQDHVIAPEEINVERVEERILSKKRKSKCESVFNALQLITIVSVVGSKPQAMRDLQTLDNFLYLCICANICFFGLDLLYNMIIWKFLSAHNINSLKKSIVFGVIASNILGVMTLPRLFLSETILWKDQDSDRRTIYVIAQIISWYRSIPTILLVITFCILCLFLPCACCYVLLGDRQQRN